MPGSSTPLDTIKRILDLWLALQLTIGMALTAAVGFVAGLSAVRQLVALVVVPFTLASALVVIDNAPATEPLWTVGLAVLGTAIGVSVLAYLLDLSLSGPVTYLVATVLVAVGYATHRGFKSLARSTLTE